MKKMVSILCGLLMGVIPSNRISNGLISEILGTVFEGTALGVANFIYLPKFFDKLFQIHGVYVEADDIKEWSKGDFLKHQGKRIRLRGDSISGNKYVFLHQIARRLGFENYYAFEENFNLDLDLDLGCKRFCICFWAYLFLDACSIPDTIGRLLNIYSNVKSSNDIEKCKNELEKYQKIHENHVNKIENKNRSGSSYEGKK